MNRILILTLMFLGSGCTVNATRSHEFALIGDNPYSAALFDRYLAMIEDINSYPAIRWVIHLGDVKSSDDSCADESMQRYFDFNQRFAMPFVVTPGDNDWLDCKRAGAGGFSEFERLEAFRRLFFPEPGYSTGRTPMRVDQQSAQSGFGEFVENLRWRNQDVIYATVHTVALTVPSSDQSRDQLRVEAAQAWIRQTFEEARSTDARAVFMAMQADPWPMSGNAAAARLPRASLEWLYPVLAEQALAFGKPVVLAVGDTHLFRVDKPLYVEGHGLVENFTRVESFGNPQLHWVNVTVEPDTPWVFSFREQRVD